jgi:hypothetical protein
MGRLALTEEQNMAKSNDANTPGRTANAAQPLGERKGLVSDDETEQTGKREQRSAGPDGPDAAAVGRTFKRR